MQGERDTEPPLPDWRAAYNNFMGIATIDWNEPLDLPCQGGALTIGNFDGVHRGHQALLAEMHRQAERVKGPAVVLTFDPHPLQLLRPETCPPLLTTFAERTRLLLAAGANHIVILRTRREMLQLTAREFFDRVIRARLQPRVLVPGYNFGFGRGREGNVESLAHFCAEVGMEFVLVQPLEVEGEPVSSSRVRAALLAGQVELAGRLLGRPYRLQGVVGHGRHRGRGLGFPTANLEEIATLIPATGVYAVQVEMDGQLRPGAANIGPNPTFGEEARKVEVHLIGYAGPDLYGRRLALDVVKRLRDTRAFAGAAELVEQLRRDVEEARRAVEEASTNLDLGGNR